MRLGLYTAQSATLERDVYPYWCASRRGRPIKDTNRLSITSRAQNYAYRIQGLSPNAQ